MPVDSEQVPQAETEPTGRNVRVIDWLPRLAAQSILFGLLTQIALWICCRVVLAIAYSVSGPFGQLMGIPLYYVLWPASRSGGGMFPQLLIWSGVWFCILLKRKVEFIRALRYY
jgi:hypothetical protein